MKVKNLSAGQEISGDTGLRVQDLKPVLFKFS